MKVDSSAHQYSYIHKSTGKNHFKQEEPQSSQPLEQTSPAVEADLGDGDTPQVKGVIRNLLEGHYKGVADIRLRINFHDELASLQQAEALQLTGEKTADVVDDIRSQVETFTADLDPTLSEQVTDALNDFSNTASESSGFSTEDLSLSLENAFGDLIDKLRGVLLPANEISAEELTDVEPLEAEPTDDNVHEPDANVEESTESPAEPVPESATEVVLSPEPTVDPAEAFLAELTSAFQNALIQLKDDINQFSILPEPSPPQGNGRAYDKFMAIYQSMISGSSSPETTPDVPASPEDTPEIETIV